MGPSDTGPPWPLLLLALSAVVKPGGATARFRGLYTNDLSEAYETIPKKVTPLGDHISHDVTTYHEHNDDHVHFNVSIEGVQHLLALKPSKAFIAPSVVVERRGKDLHTRSRIKRESSRCHFHGVVDGQPGSRVAISTCNGLSGVIHSKLGKYYIEPSHNPVKTVTPGHKHLVYKRSAVISSYPKKKRKKKRRKQSNCGTREPRKLTLLEWQSQLGKLKVQEKTHKHKDKVKISKLKQSDMKKLMYRKVKSKNRRSISTEHFVETLVVADSSMVEFHQEGDIETYILTLMNMVSSLYLDPSIGNSVQVVVVKIILLDDQFAEPGLNVTTNADTTLRHFCKWQVALNPGDDSHPHHHDAAILITRKDICARQDTPCGTLGVAHIGGMCKVGRSCSVNEDNGITSAHTIAHEMGHNFGMLHDTEKTGCKRRRGSILHIMTPSFEADTITVSWSECSRREITRFLDKGLGKCLQDPPRELEKYEYPELPAGAMYNGDHQCRLQFGSDATVCSPLDEICSRLWCSINDTCTTLLKPAAAGTSCGKHKWCQEQRCVPMMEPPAAIDGGWGDWGPWSPCTRTCGAGVSVRERECDHPRPAAGGRFCVGERRRYKICNTHPCPAGQPTFRATQCSAYNDHPYEGKRYEWQPYFDQGEPCQLYCSDANETVIVPWGDYAIDGTPCSVVSRDICISGICKKVGCDWVVDSTAKEDDCGICQGDGTKCDKVQGEYMKQSRSPGYREIAFIPRGARNVRIEEMGHSENYISIGSALSRKFYLNGKRHITLPGEYTVAGTQALYERDNQMEKIRIPGPVLEHIVVYIYFRGKVYNPGVEYKYSIWKPDTTTEVRYSWILGDWSPCSATCGGGSQRRLPLCQESTVTSAASEMERPHTVDDSKCESKDKPKKLERKCNENPCPYHWWVGPWQACPVSCSEKGKKPSQRRSVMCVDAHEMALPDHFCDKKMKPHEYQPCKHLPPCDPLG